MELKTVDIKGKKYVTVAERIKYFRNTEQYKDYGIEINWIEVTDTRAVAKAIIRDGNGVIKSEGTAMEEKDNKSSMVNKTSHIENCETSAVGRALGFLGIGIDGAEVSTYEETLRAKKRQFIDSINNMIDDKNREEYEEKYRLNELGLLSVEQLEEIETKLKSKEKDDICKAISKIASSQKMSEIMKYYGVKNIGNLDLVVLKKLHDHLVVSKNKISKNELQDLMECADIVDVNLDEYCEREYHKKPSELVKEEYQEIKKRLNK